MGTARGLARVRREALAACMTCPLCRGLLRAATAITLCLHTCESRLLSHPPSLPVYVLFVRSSSLSAPVSARARAGGGHGFPARAAAPALALVSSRLRTSFWCRILLPVLSFGCPRRSGWCPMRVL